MWTKELKETALQLSKHEREKEKAAILSKSKLSSTQKQALIAGFGTYEKIDHPDQYWG